LRPLFEVTEYLENFKELKMKQFLRWVVSACLATALANTASAQQSAPPPAQSSDKTPPTYDMKAQATLDLQQLKQKFTQLAAAIPQEKYSWRPAEGVRSINELFLHVAGAGFYFPTLKGTPAAPGFTAKDFEKSTTDKAKVIEWLNQSFTYAMASVESMSNAEFANLLPKLGPSANEGDVVYFMVVHAHEHLGQAISYSRSVGIVPPWTAEAAKKNAKAPQD
jgi:uncharacterized damage-inducible protein DinB